MSAFSQIPNAAASIIEYLGGSQTQTGSATRGTNQTQTAAGSTADQTDTASSNTSTNTDTAIQQIIQGLTVTSNNSATTTQNVANPQYLNQLQNLASQAISNSNDPTKTTGLITGILQTAGDTIGGIFGTQQQSGMYNSASAATQVGNTEARAAADAASAVLGYQTSEQSIAQGALGTLIQATMGTATNSGSNTTVASNQATNTNTQNDVTSATNNTQTDSSIALSQGNSVNTTNQLGTQSSSTSPNTIVCTWMMKHRRMTRRAHAAVHAEYIKEKQWKIDGYLTAAALLVKELERDHTSLFSRFILWTFHHRTEYVCALKGETWAKKTVSGWTCRTLVAIFCTPTSLYFLARSLLKVEARTEARS